LEFPSVFIIATEEGLLPHERCSEDPDQLEEERRLLFVGITRAERELQLSLVQYRSFRGQRRATIPSQFLMELPRESMQYTEPGGGFGGAGGFGGVYDAEDFDQDEGSDASNAWQDEDFIQEAPEAFAGGLPPGVVPASRLQASRSGRREQAQDTRFRVGSWVTHPDYGEGTVIAVSGRSAKRAVRVLFNDDGRSRSFLVEHSPLVPVED
jgi:DNA helicase-2/ATP-dependent DNA helicase PcrA